MGVGGSFLLNNIFVVGVGFLNSLGTIFSSFSFNIFFLLFLFYGGSLLFFVQHSLIHSHKFFRVFGGSVSVGQCAFLCLGNKS